MSFFRFGGAIILSCFATAVMSYISMAVPIGPWIETTLVLLGMIIFSIRRYSSAQVQIADIGLATAAGGIGGILATGMGFTLPTLYFVDASLFHEWLAHPIYFILVLTLLALSAGSLGLAVAQICEHKLLIQDNMPFPIGELVQKVITAQNTFNKTISLIAGFIGTTILLYAQKCSQFIVQQIIIIQKFNWSIISFPSIILKTELIPMFVAIGFITGHLIAVPLAIGFLLKIVILDPLHYIYINPDNLIHNFFIVYFKPIINFISKLLPIGNAYTPEEFAVAFCSGMVVYGVIISFLDLPKYIKRIYNNWRVSGVDKSIFKIFLDKTRISWGQCGTALISSFILLSYFKFSYSAQIYLLVFTCFWIYQVLIIAGKMGIAPLGRFATFVMVPGMLFFNFTALQATLVATFVEIAVGVASDTLFGRKMAQLAHIDRTQIVRYQWLGLLISAACIGVIFWLIIYHFGIGPGTDLSVIKAQSRALLINSKNFDFLVLFLGLLCGYLLSIIKINPALVLGGILMPPSYSLVLIIGGLCTYLVRDKEAYYPFWSGVFAANSMWMLIQTFFKTVVCR
jgi:hypothetical protein